MKDILESSSVDRTKISVKIMYNNGRKGVSRIDQISCPEQVRVMNSGDYVYLTRFIRFSKIKSCISLHG